METERRHRPAAGNQKASGIRALAHADGVRGSGWRKSRKKVVWLGVVDGPGRVGSVR
jgi:hypothetical protein